MNKKYELLKDSYWYRVKALKDFTLITGEIIKKNDVGGCVNSEDCLSQEGNCWIMDDSYVLGKVSGNAVVKNRGCVFGQVSGNAIVKDYGFVRENAIVTGNAVVQAYQHITYGTVTTDLLGTKDWTGALYAEFGITPENGKIILYKKVWSTDNPNVFKSHHNRDFFYEVGKEAIETDVDEDVLKWCGKGLHFTTLEFIGFQGRNIILECEVNVEDVITIQDRMVRARKCRVIKTIEEEE